MKKVISSDVGRISELIIKGLECWVEAGEIVAGFLEANPNGMAELCKQTGLSEDIVRRFEQIGRREIYPKLLANTGPGFIRLASCPYREQKQYCETPIPLLIVYDDGRTDTILVGVSNLTSDQCRQAFAKSHVRSLSEQRAYIESERKKAVEKSLLKQNDVQPAPFTIRGKRVIFRAGCEMTVVELGELIARLA